MAKILVVEDEQDIRDTYLDTLEHVGHTVKAVSTRAEAVQLLPRFKPDVVLLDINLPGGSGVLVLSYIRCLREFNNTKVVIVSGMPEMARDAVQNWGADLYLLKPVTTSLLRDTVEAYTS